MPNVNLSLDLASLFVDAAEPDGEPANLRDAMRAAVVEAAAKQLLTNGMWSHDELFELRQEVHRMRNKLITERLRAEVEGAFSEPIQRMTQWGEKRGDVTSVRELIRLELEAFLNGTSTSRRRDSYDKTPNNLAELIGVVANDTMNSALSKSVRDAKATVDKRVQEILTEAIGAKLAGVKK